MRILVISPKIPYPLNEGASLRTFNILRELSRKHEVCLAALWRPGDSAGSPIEEFSRVIKVHHARKPGRRLMQIALSPLNAGPYLQTVHESAAMQALVNEIAGNFDAVQAEFPYTAQYITHLPVMKVLDQHNVESEILRLSFRMEKNWARRANYFLQYRKMKAYERWVCGKMDAILATSEDDRRNLSALNRNVLTIPNAVSEVAQAAEDRANKLITFTGLMSYPANVDAMEHFAGQVWPLVRRGEPGARLLIVGRNPVPQVLKLNGVEGIEVKGNVPEIGAYIREASVIIAPLRIGSGTRIKIIEALAQGKPVVSTSLGCMGLEVRHGENILVADEPRAFADNLLLLLGDKRERLRIGRAGLELVKNKYTWEKACQGLKEVYGNQPDNDLKK